MKLNKAVLVLLVAICFCGKVSADAINRVKRVSDQRLAELETYIGLSKLSGKLVTVPIGFGKVDPKLIGRKRRSQSRLLDALFNNSLEDSAEEPLLYYEDGYDKKR